MSMANLLMFINPLKTVDIVFFIVCVAIVAIGVGIYFLIPVFNKKQYQEQRDNLRKREEAFKANAKIVVESTQDQEVDIKVNIEQEKDSK